MKKHLRWCLIIITIIFVGACSNASADKEKNSTSENKDQAQDSIVQNTDVAEVVFNDDYIMNIEKVYNGEVVNDLIVSSYKYEPNIEFSFMLNGEFIADGEIMIDEMWGELAIVFDKINNPHKNIKIEIDDYQKQLIDFSYFRNQEDLLMTLSEEEIQKLETGEQVKLRVKVKDAKVSGKIDGYGDVSVKFVEIIR